MADPMDRIGLIAEQLNEVVDGLQEITGYGKRTRRLTWIAIGTFVFDIALTIMIGFAISQGQVNACHTSNEARAGQIVIWHTIVEKFTNPHPTKAQQANETRFLNFVDANFHPVQCHRYYWP